MSVAILYPSMYLIGTATKRSIIKEIPSIIEIFISLSI
jgi:hypothetical protein